MIWSQTPPDSLPMPCRQECTVLSCCLGVDVSQQAQTCTNVRRATHKLRPGPCSSPTVTADNQPPPVLRARGVTVRAHSRGMNTTVLRPATPSLALCVALLVWPVAAVGAVMAFNSPSGYGLFGWPTAGWLIAIMVFSSPLPLSLTSILTEKYTATPEASPRSRWMFVASSGAVPAVLAGVVGWTVAVVVALPMLTFPLFW